MSKLINADPEFATKFKALTASRQKGMIRMAVLIANAFDSFADFEQALGQYGRNAAAIGSGEGVVRA